MRLITVSRNASHYGITCTHFTWYNVLRHTFLTYYIFGSGVVVGGGDGCNGDGVVVAVRCDNGNDGCSDNCFVTFHIDVVVVVVVVDITVIIYVHLSQSGAVVCLLPRIYVDICGFSRDPLQAGPMSARLKHHLLHLQQVALAEERYR